MDRVKGKIAIVSGAASGMGLEHVRSLAREGAKVVGFDLVEGEGSALVDELGDGTFHFLPNRSVTSASDWAEVVRALRGQFRGADSSGQQRRNFPIDKG